MTMNTKSTSASGQGNAAAKKKGSGSGASKPKQSAPPKRATLDVGSRTRIDKPAARSRSTSKHPRNASKARRRASPRPEHLEAPIEEQDDESLDESMDDNDDNDDDATPPPARRPRTRSTALNPQEAYQIELRRRVDIKRLEEKLGLTPSAQRTLPSSPHTSYLPAVPSVPDPSNPYSSPPNPWLPPAPSEHMAETRTAFLHNVDPEYSRVEKKFISVPLRLLKDVYHCALNPRNLSRFTSS